MAASSCDREQSVAASLFSAGDLVDVKARGRATVLEAAPGGPAAAAEVAAAAPPRHSFAGRVHVRFHEDGTTYWVNPSNLRRMCPSTSRIVVAYRTELYRAAITHNVEYHHCCLEVGSHTGTTTALLHRQCGGRVVGVDIVPLVVQGARKRFPGVRFELADGADLAALRALSPNNLDRPPPANGSGSSPSCTPQPVAGSDCGTSSSGSLGHVASTGPSTRSAAALVYDIVCVDLSGKAPLRVVVPLLAAYLSEWPATRLIVKNEALFCAVEAWQQQQGSSSSGTGEQHPAQQQGAVEGTASAEQQQQQQRLQQAEDGQERVLSDLLAGWQLNGGSSNRSSRNNRSSGTSSNPSSAVVQQLDGGASVDPNLVDPAAAHCQLSGSLACQLAAVLRECELFRSDGYRSHTDKPVNKAKARRCHHCGQGSIGKWTVHNRQCTAKQAALAIKREAKATAAAEAEGRPPSCLP